MSHYLVLISLTNPNKSVGNKIIANLQSVSDATVAPVWIDSAYIGIPIASEHNARAIWQDAVKGLNETGDFRDMLIIELGRDWMGRQDARATHWLRSHLGNPLL